MTAGERGEHLRMRIMVTGSRHWTDYHHILRTLAAFRRARPTIVHGDAPGADRLCDRAAKALGYPIDPYPVTDEEWRRIGRAAGVLRNEQMYRTEPDLVIAFRAPGKSNGTDDAIARALAGGTPCWVVTNLDRALEAL